VIPARDGTGGGHAGLLMLLILVLSLATGSSPAPAAEIAIVVPKDETRTGIRHEDLARIFRRKLRVSATGRVLVPVNLPVSHPLRQAFTRALLGHSPESMRDYWNEQYFHGISPPYVLASQEAVIRFVSHTPGAIAYILDCRLDARVRAIFRLAVPADYAAIVNELCP